jgi:class 3 adenylate cyclase
VVRREGGHEVDARADEFFAVFERPAAALEAAVAMQRAIRTHSWPDGRDVRVRIGLHTGRPTLTATGYQGLSVNAAARICDCAHGGQIIVSRSTHTALGEASRATLRSLGMHRLRGISDEHELFQVVVGDAAEDTFPPLRIGV